MTVQTAPAAKSKLLSIVGMPPVAIIARHWGMRFQENFPGNVEFWFELYYTKDKRKIICTNVFEVVQERSIV